MSEIKKPMERVARIGSLNDKQALRNILYKKYHHGSSWLIFSSSFISGPCRNLFEAVRDYIKNETY